MAKKKAKKKDVKRVLVSAKTHKMIDDLREKDETFEGAILRFVEIVKNLDPNAITTEAGLVVEYCNLTGLDAHVIFDRLVEREKMIKVLGGEKNYARALAKPKTYAKKVDAAMIFATRKDI